MRLAKWDAYRVYLILSGVSSFAFAVIFTLNLVYQGEVVGLTPLQLVLVGTTLEITAFLFEIPTGIVADLYSRRLSVLIGFFLIGVGFVIEGSLPFFWAVLLNQVIWGIGSTFTSGALEAWIVDEVGEARMGHTLMRGSQAGQIGGIAGIIVSVALGSITLALPVIAGGVIFIALTALLIMVMPENGFKPLPPDQRGSSWASMARTVRTTVKLVRLRPMLVMFLAVGLVLGLYSEGYDRLWRAHLLDDITLPALGTLQPVVWFGIISGVSMLLVTLMTEIIRRRVDTHNQRAVSRTLVALYGVIVAALLIFGLAGEFPLALAALLVVNTLRGTTEPLLSTWTNQHIDSNIRATMLSSLGQIDAIGQIGGGPIVGLIGDRWGLRAALSICALLLAPVVVLIARASRRVVAMPEAADVAAAD